MMTPKEVTALLASRQSYEEDIRRKEQQIAELKRQIAWFQRQLFGRKSEQRILGSSAQQLGLGEFLEKDGVPPAPEESVKSYQRKQRRKIPLQGSPEDTGLRFDASVPVEEIEVPNPALRGLKEDAYTVLDEECTYRLAQRPGSYVVLKYKRKVVKLKSEERISTPPAPAAVFEKSYADVSFLAGLLIDKFLYHLPLYRQHQRLQAAGVVLSRVTLTNLVHRTADLLEPIYYALFSSVLQSKVLAMDETPIKVGRAGNGKMKRSYFWPIYGDQDEVVFPFSPSHSTKVVHEALGEWCGVLLTDGYKVYDRFTEKVRDRIHAQCWAHTRRKFEEAQDAEPQLAAIALEIIGEIYAHEARIRKANLPPEKLLEFRAIHSKPPVDRFFSWLSEMFQTQVLLPSNPFSAAASYALQREEGLRVFLQYPAVPIDTNHLERTLRPIPMGRKNWLFCWTEIGARYVGIIQSILQSCRLQGVSPYTYLVDVLQRIDSHPAIDVHLLTPRLWKENFAHNPLRSDLERQYRAV